MEWKGHRVRGLRGVERAVGQRSPRRSSPTRCSPMPERRLLARPRLARRGRRRVPRRRGDDRSRRAAAGAGGRDRSRRLRGAGAAAVPDAVHRGAGHLRGRPDMAQADNGWGPPEVDRSNGERAPDDGGPIRIGAAAFEHGIGAHAPSRIVDRAWTADARLFLADVGLDEEVGDQGSVVFEVWGDGQLATSGLVRGPQTSRADRGRRQGRQNDGARRDARRRRERLRPRRLGQRPLSCQSP